MIDNIKCFIQNQTNPILIGNLIKFLELKIMEYLLSLKLISIYPLNLKLTKFDTRGCNCYCAVIIALGPAVKYPKLKHREPYLTNIFNLCLMLML
jgi:hypothetical protein